MKGLQEPELGEPATSKSHYAIMESIMQRSQTHDVALNNGVRNIQKKTTPRPPPLSTIEGVCTDLASKATLGKRTEETLRAEERPPKKAAITSLNRPSGAGPININPANSDRQSNLNEASDAITSVTATGGPLQCSSDIRQYHWGKEPAGAELQLEVEGSSAMKLMI
jgi:ketopantoate reductase